MSNFVLFLWKSADFFTFRGTSDLFSLLKELVIVAMEHTAPNNANLVLCTHLDVRKCVNCVKILTNFWKRPKKFVKDWNIRKFWDIGVGDKIKLRQLRMYCLSTLFDCAFMRKFSYARETSRAALSFKENRPQNEGRSNRHEAPVHAH